MIKETYTSSDPVIDPYLDNRLRSDKPITFLGFIDEFKKLWSLAGKEAEFIRQQPFHQDMNFPIITYHTLRRMVNRDFKEIKPRYRTTIRHPYIPDEYVELKGQIFDVWVQFDVCSTSADEADLLVEELDDFIQTYRGYFKKNGVQEITFFAQETDIVDNSLRFPIAVRPVQYTFRFEKITPIFLNQIEQIVAQATAVKPQELNV